MWGRLGKRLSGRLETWRLRRTSKSSRGEAQGNHKREQGPLRQSRRVDDSDGESILISQSKERNNHPCKLGDFCCASGWAPRSGHNRRTTNDRDHGATVDCISQHICGTLPSLLTAAADTLKHHVHNVAEFVGVVAGVVVAGQPSNGVGRSVRQAEALRVDIQLFATREKKEGVKKKNKGKKRTKAASSHSSSSSEEDSDSCVNEASTRKMARGEAVGARALAGASTCAARTLRSASA